MLLRSSFLIHFQSVQLITNYRCCALLMVSFTLLGRYKPLMPRGGWGSWVLVPIFFKKGIGACEQLWRYHTSQPPWDTRVEERILNLTQVVEQ